MHKINKTQKEKKIMLLQYSAFGESELGLCGGSTRALP